MIKVGLTGGIGSGKTFVSKVFLKLGIPVLYADELAKSIVSQNSKVHQQISAEFGEEFFIPTGELNNSKLGDLVFEDSQKLNQLNKIVHPVVAKETNAWFTDQGTDYAIKEAAILFESGAYEELDKTIIVTSPIQLRIKRLLSREGMNETKAHNIMDKQWSDDRKIRLADFHIINDEKTLLLPQILSIHKKLLELNDSK